MGQQEIVSVADEERDHDDPPDGRSPGLDPSAFQALPDRSYDVLSLDVIEDEGEERDDGPMLEWLAELGIDLDAEDDGPAPNLGDQFGGIEDEEDDEIAA